MTRIEVRIPLSTKMNGSALVKFLQQLQKTDSLYSLRIDCTVEIP